MMLTKTALGCTGWREWFRPMKRDFRFECPTCGTTHKIDFRKSRTDGEIEMRVKTTRVKPKP